MNRFHISWKKPLLTALGIASVASVSYALGYRGKFSPGATHVDVEGMIERFIFFFVAPMLLYCSYRVISWVSWNFKSKRPDRFNSPD